MGGSPAKLDYKSLKIEDHRSLGFYMVLKGRCDLVYEVVKVRNLDLVDSSQGTGANDPIVRQIELYHEEREAEVVEGGTL